jgi:Galactose oxidase, central domain
LTATLARILPKQFMQRSYPGMALVSACVAVLLAVAACGGAASSSSSSSARTGRSRQHHAAGPVAPAKLAYRPLFTLSAPLRDPASAPLPGDRFVLLGGLDAADTSTAGIELASRHGTLHRYTLPLAQHDAQGAAIGGRVYVFGGGSLSELDHIISFDPGSGAVQTVGALPQAQSDVAVAQIGGTAYIVGGFDGTNWLDTILAWRPGAHVRVAGRLPIGLRYSAVSVADGRLLVSGGSTPSGASRAIYSFDPPTGQVRQIGNLPHPVTHGAAATLGSTVYLVGGRGELDNQQTALIWAIDPESGAVHAAGRLPQPLSDTGVLTVGNAIVVAGGLNQAGNAVANVGELVPAR